MIQKKKTVLVTGVFDILHQEHILFLQKAKRLGDFLIIGIESDSRVSQMKGINRPINSQQSRLEKLKVLNIANEIFILPEKFNIFEDHLKLIKKIKPDFLAVSSHTKHLDKKQEIMSLIGGKVVVVHQHNPEISTTKVLAEQKK